MTNKMYLMGAAVAAIMAASPAMAAVNLLTNGSFENGVNTATGAPAGWTIDNNYTSSTAGREPIRLITYGVQNSTPGSNGAYEAIPTDNAVNANSPDAYGTHGIYFVSDNANPQSLYQTLTLAAGTYNAGFDWFVPTGGAGNANGGSLIVTLNGQTIGTLSASPNNAGVWQTVNTPLTFSVGATGDYKFGFTSGAQPAKDIVIDRAYVTAVPEPATWAMMGLGFAAVGFAARRRSKVAARTVTA